jgi:1-acyl-sn-glycerol-3-phosphate acyltransferase
LSPKAFKDAFKEAVNRLRHGNIVALFPEGEISKDCNLGNFKRGFELIEGSLWDGVVVAFYIDGMQGSIFAKCNDGRKKPLFRREVKVCFFEALPKEVSAKELKEILERKRKTC